MSKSPSSVPLVVVDVQPAYTLQWDLVPALMERINAHEGPVVMMVVAEGEGLTTDTVADCVAFWLENGMDEDVAERIHVVDKGYGYLRAWMDNGVDQDVIVAVLRRMMQEDVNDTRELPEDVVQAVAGDHYESWMVDDPLIGDWIDGRILRTLEGAILCGGGENECLLEVELLLRAHSIGHTVDREFVYSDLPPPIPVARHESLRW
jgi:hypothetical protein